MPEGSQDAPQWMREGDFYYDLERDIRFDELRDRLVIDWGKGALAWVQNLKHKPVLEIRAPGRQLPAFEDYLEFSLSYPQLKSLFGHGDAHLDWRASLSAVGGVYLILAEASGERSGDQYVGSAYGVDGIWGRWRQYSTSGHGDNAKLRELVDGDGRYPNAFRFSVLQILPKSLTRNETIRHETRYKEKLGTRATGLNSN